MAILKPNIAHIDKQIALLSPVVGYYLQPPQPGAFLSAGAAIGKLKILNAFHELVLPEELSGEVCYHEQMEKSICVEYNQELFRINPEVHFGKSAKQAAGESEKVAEALEVGQVIPAFITGIFYAKSSPDAPAYVSVGQEVKKGEILGLIEVMKTFYQLVFQGLPHSEKGEVKKIFVEDSQEVKQGQKLFLIAKSGLVE